MQSDSTKVSVSEVLDFDQKWNYANPVATEVEFRKFLAVAPATKLNYRAQLLTQIARTHSLRGNFAEAHVLLDEVSCLLETNELPVASVRYQLERGRCFNSAGDKKKAVVFFSEAYNLSKSISADTYTIDALHMLGIAEEPPKALEWNNLAIEFCEKATAPNVKKWLSPLYNNTGWTYHGMGEFEKALTLFEKNVTYGEKANFPTSQQEISKWTVARCYRSLKRYDDAIVIQKQLEKAKNTSGSEDGYVYEEIAELLLIKDEAAQSKIYFTKAYALLSEDSWLMKNESTRMERMQQLSL